MDGPSELSLFEIRKFILENGCKVTNHALVKHFKQFLTNPDSQNEARKQFKTYVNILATIKNDDNQKYLLLRKKYLHECPSEDIVNRTDVPPSPGNSSINSDGFASPFRQPPPYKPPPEVSPTVGKLTRMASETKENYRDCVNEFAAAVRKIDPNRMQDEVSDSNQINISTPNESVPSLPPRNRSSVGQLSLSRENSIENDNKENVKSNTEGLVTTPLAPPDNSNENTEKNRENCASDVENPISVKEATRKFNRMASEEEARIISPPGKKKQEKPVVEDRMSQEVTFAHPKAKEWIVSSAKANYQELAKLAQDYPELVKLQDPTTGYTALHWACKHGNEDVVKLIAGTYKAEVNARTNGGYTPLHLAMQFGRDNIFELLCNVYKANRDAMDWSGNKPLDYRKQHTTVSASTYSSEYSTFAQNSPLSPQSNQFAAGATVSLARKKRSQPRYATVVGNSLHRTQSLMIGGKGLQSLFVKDSPSDQIDDQLTPAYPSPEASIKHNNNNDAAGWTKYQGEVSKDNYGTFRKRGRESFLRKKYRSASRGKTQEVVTNQSVVDT